MAVLWLLFSLMYLPLNINFDLISLRLLLLPFFMLTQLSLFTFPHRLFCLCVPDHNPLPLAHEPATLLILLLPERPHLHGPVPELPQLHLEPMRALPDCPQLRLLRLQLLPQLPGLPRVPGLRHRHLLLEQLVQFVRLDELLGHDHFAILFVEGAVGVGLVLGVLARQAHLGGQGLGVAGGRGRLRVEGAASGGRPRLHRIIVLHAGCTCLVYNNRQAMSADQSGDKYPNYPPYDSQVSFYAGSSLKINPSGSAKLAKICPKCQFPIQIRICIRPCMHYLCYECYIYNKHECAYCSSVACEAVRLDDDAEVYSCDGDCFRVFANGEDLEAHIREHARVRAEGR